MKKVFLLIVLFSAATVATPAWSQTPAPPAPAARPAQPAQAPPAAQAPRPAPAARPATPVAPPAVPAEAAPPTPLSQQISLRPAANVRFDVTITDTGGAKPVVKTLSLTVSSTNSNGSVRTTAKMPGIDPNSPFPQPAPAGSMMAVPLNVDVRNVTWVDANAIRATINVEYQPYLPDAKSQPGVISASAQSLFYDGRRTQILVASDPVSDRKTTIEVMATIVK